ncbi:uncharacterized protein LOC134239082 [Saccostrea cucullata]|uniref:uncharacterized protein LOC134239082 n=1 Tax=Saccostrea cuccullata TaxID=36930 RepID=UPI002ED4F8C7
MEKKSGMASSKSKSSKTPQRRDENLQQYQGEMSDEDSPGIPQGQGASSSSSPWEKDSPAVSMVMRGPISSRSGRSTKQRELKKKSEAQDGTFMEFLTDKKWLAQIIILGLVQASMTYAVHSRLQGSIKDLKACSRSSPETDKSKLQCSDCMCIATDGFSSSEFKNIIKNQNTLSNELDQKTKELEDMEKRLAGIENMVSEFPSPDDMKYTVEKLKDSKVVSENLQSDITSSLEKFIESRFQDKFESIESNMGKKIKDEVQKKSDHVDNKLLDIQEIFKEQVNKSEVKMASLIEDEKSERTTKLKELEGNVTELKTSAYQNFTEVESKYRGVEGQLKYFFSEIKDINIYIVGFLLVLVMGVIFVAYKILLPRLPPGGDQIRQVTQVRDPPPRSRVGGQGTPVDIDRITKRPLERSIGIISFNTSTQQFHQNLINKVPKPRSMDVHPGPIQCLNDILRIKPSKVVFVFVDFNERNIILEDPETEIGDLRRLTTQGLLNMGSDVFVVYVRDRGSETLGPGQLYNPQLHSIGHHSLLSQLKERNRVLSVYNSFLPHQVKFLEDSLKRL